MIRVEDSEQDLAPQSPTVISMPASHMMQGLLRLSELSAVAGYSNIPAQNGLLLQQASAALRHLRAEFMQAKQDIEQDSEHSSLLAKLQSDHRPDFLVQLDNLITCAEHLANALTKANE